MRSADLHLIALLTALGGGVALGVAEASQYWGGLVPCALCLVERWPYRVVIAVGLIASIVPRDVTRVLLWLAFVALLAAAVLGAIHVGVEQGLWPSPLPECAAPHISIGNLSQMLSSLPARPSKPCDAPSFLIPGLPVSMAAMNLIYALALAALLATSLLQRRRRYA